VIIDAHTHLMKKFNFLEGVPVEEEIVMLHQGGADCCVIFTIEGLLRNYKFYNDEIAEAARQFPDTLIPFCTIDPYDPQGLQELDRCVQQLGMKGIKFHPWLQAFSIVDPIVLPIIERASEYGIPVISHDGTPPYCTTFEVSYLAGVFPKAKIILGHVGLKDYPREAIAAARRYDNLYFCFCGTTLQCMQAIVKIAGPERCMFGSDLPFAGPDFLKLEIYKVKRLGLSKQDEDGILGNNVARLLGLI
jgi:predicted TIM-barrel fold metal-dependent hydrolase